MDRATSNVAKARFPFSSLPHVAIETGRLKDLMARVSVGSVQFGQLGGRYSVFGRFEKCGGFKTVLKYAEGSKLVRQPAVC